MEAIQVSENSNQPEKVVVVRYEMNRIGVKKKIEKTSLNWEGQ